MLDGFALVLALAARPAAGNFVGGWPLPCSPPRSPCAPRRTWAFRRAEVLAALGQAAVLLAVDHVRDVHASVIVTGLPVLCAYLVVENRCFTDGHAPRILDQLQDCVAKRFDVQVEHSTFQVGPATHPDHEHPVDA